MQIENQKESKAVKCSRSVLGLTTQWLSQDKTKFSHGDILEEVSWEESKNFIAK